MVLTSLSTEQLIGVNAVSYQNNFSIIAWTVPTVIPLCFLALYMLPKYLRNGYTTIPEFFENRFDRQTRLIMSGLFLVFYLLIVIPTALYTGAIPCPIPGPIPAITARPAPIAEHAIIKSCPVIFI